MSSKEWGEIEWEGAGRDFSNAVIGRDAWMKVRILDRMGDNSEIRFGVPGDTTGWVPGETVFRIETQPRTYTEGDVREVLRCYLMNDDSIRDVLHQLREAKR